ncbi:MAG TPA: protein-L-isoaspartate O-methyltransferase [Geminicoccaceae bacterium]|nr:protein-L-isoaspartate O-methyltransferase [Geminicoccaceae bacterium]
MTDYALARLNMVANQLKPSEVMDPRVLSAMAEVPRELFLPKHLRGIAYADEDIMLPGGGHLMEPLAFARMLQAAEIRPEDVVLVVGCRTGYAAAVLARLAATVILLQPGPADAEQVEIALDRLGVDNVVVAAAEPGTVGHPSQAPYDVILLAGSVPEVPPALLEQIGDGGRLMAVVDDGRIGKGTLFVRVRGVVGHKVLFDANIPPLDGLNREPDFVF